jgi:alkanesulfonate monooxygenase SsuD/methylene tetrahydromethanopterin reductase-like flavin-dependent oxidoreductase (luciferase family)
MPLRVAVELPSDLVSSGEFLADVRAYEAAGADAVWLTATSLEPLTLLAAAAAVTSRVELVVAAPAPGRWPADLLAAVTATLRHLGGDRVAVGAAEAERWARVPAPSGRAAWREALASAEEAGAAGVVVPHAPNLLDILRNPEEDDRGDLAMATG